MRRLGAKRGVDVVLAVNRKVRVIQGLRGGVVGGLETGWNRLIPLRSGGGDEKLVV